MPSVKQAWINKYGIDEGLRLWEEHKTKICNTLEKYIIRYGEIEGLNKWNKRIESHKGKCSLDWFVQKFGDQVGPEKYKTHCSKLSVGYNTLKSRGYSDDEIHAIKQQHSEKSKNDLKTFIQRYGEIEGKIKHENYRQKQRQVSKRSLDYWLQQTNGDELLSIKLLGDYQKRDLNWYICKFGEIDGPQRFFAANSKKGRTLENYINKYGFDVGFEKYSIACKNFKNNQRGIFNSKGQLEVEEFLNTEFSNVKGARNETGIILTDAEKSAYIKNNIMYPDIIVNDKVIINYHGDYWHANPEIYKNPMEIHNRSKKTVYEIHQIDYEKNLILQNRGYFVITIWESEWYKDKEVIKAKIKELINENS